MSSCPFEGNEAKPCPIPVDYPAAFISRKCEADCYGRNCAAIVCQELVARTIDLDKRTSAIDELLGKINGQFRLTRVPEGAAPQPIRESIASMAFPLREKRPPASNAVYVSHTDLCLTLLNAEKLEETNWYSDYHNQYGSKSEPFWWMFHIDEGAVDDFQQPKDSIRQYDKSFNLHSAALSNSLLPPLLVIQDHWRQPGVIPISGLFSVSPPKAS